MTTTTIEITKMARGDWRVDFGQGMIGRYTSRRVAQRAASEWRRIREGGVRVDRCNAVDLRDRVVSYVYTTDNAERAGYWATWPERCRHETVALYPGTSKLTAAEVDAMLDGMEVNNGEGGDVDSDLEPVDRDLARLAMRAHLERIGAIA
jgi:hypothetical protein